jgi:hypothetical protein
MPMASLEILDCGFETCELALQAGDCLSQPRFRAFDIGGVLIVLVYDCVLVGHTGWAPLQAGLPRADISQPHISLEDRLIPAWCLPGTIPKLLGLLATHRYRGKSILL